MTYEELQQHIQTYFSDRSRPAWETKDDLQNIIWEIQDKIESLPNGPDGDE